MLKKIVLTFVVFLSAVIGVVLFNTLTFTSKQIKVNPIQQVAIPEEQIASLQEAIKIKTISFQDTTQIDYGSFDSLHALLLKRFPLVHQQLTLEKINRFSLLFTWKGSDINLKPVLLLAHQDVVPIDGASASDWEVEPFSGNINNGFIYGRGTIDIKSGIISNLQAVEYLLSKGFKPKRTLHLAFGHDEEIGGRKGATFIAKHLKKKGVEAEFVLDEGGSITSGIMPGIQTPVAIIGIAEKGYATYELSIEQDGGHSSMPSRETTIGILAQAISSVEKNPFPAAIKGAAEQMFEYAGPEMGFGMRIIFANRWLFEKLILGQLEDKNSTSASIRTTTAPTIFKAGTKENVIPVSASALVNFRILPGETVKSVGNRLKEIIDDDRIKIKLVGSHADEPSPVSDTKSFGFQTLHTTIAEVFPDAITAPYLMLGATDARHYAPICKNLLRFQPTRLTDPDLKRIHGTNERISVENYKETIRFYIRLIENACS